MNTYEMDYRIPAPNGWHYKKFRQIFNLSKGLGITKEDLTDDGMPVISYGQVHSKSNSGYSLNPSLYRYVSDKYIKSDSKCLVEKGDFIFADTSEDYLGVGNCVFIDNNKSIFAGYHSIIARFADQEEYCGRYFAFLFLTDFWRTQIRAEVMGIKVFSITQKLLRDSFVLVPPKKEQQIIAKFLANRCAKIDSIIADIEKQIELLNEYKKSLITETVTKGLNKKAK
ncbi:MAG: restriction endonuclease subunit S, partial [Butyrivibrio sp.]|nr:restriction endonuclease subunit S [Butyrivibrio sp.]